MKTTITLLFLAALALPTMAQTLAVSGHVPPHIDISGLAPDDYRYMEHEFTVAVPNTSGTVQIKAGFSEGDTSLVVRDFTLGTQSWADGTWVAPNGSGHTIGIGRFTGLDAVYVQVYNAGSLVGSGMWERP